jgi:hypothetical protein
MRSITSHFRDSEIPVHGRTVPVSCNPHERNSSAASARSPNYIGVRIGTATAKEGRGALRRTKESQSHRPPSAPAPQVEVRTRAVLPGGHCPEHQAAGPVPQRTSDVTGSRHFIGEGRSRLTQLQSSIPDPKTNTEFFNIHRPTHSSRSHRSVLRVDCQSYRSQDTVPRSLAAVLVGGHRSHLWASSSIAASRARITLSKSSRPPPMSG